MKVDNASFVPYNEKRNSVRIESRDWYGVGSLWVVDIAHVPYGCSVSLRAQPISRFTFPTDWGRFRFGLRSGHMVSRCEYLMRQTPRLAHLPATAAYRSKMAQ